MMKLCPAIFIAFLLSFSSNAQFEGKISYQVSYEALETSKQEISTMLPGKAQLFVKGPHSLFEQEVAGGGKQAFIVDAGKGSGVLVMQFLGQGYKVEMSKKEIQSLKQTQELDIIPTSQTMEIAGYECQKALAASPTDTLELFYSENLKSESGFPPFAKIDGLPLKYELVRGGIKMTYTAIEVEAYTVENSVFTTAPDMQALKFADFARSFAISAE